MRIIVSFGLAGLSLAVASALSIATVTSSQGAVATVTAIPGVSAADETEVKTILIEGSRGSGDESQVIFVDGITEGLVGQTVTPYFRFPGQSGFTAGSGTRTVDANGDFSWQRKTGKRIVVEFRAGDTRSNAIIIQAR